MAKVGTVILTKVQVPSTGTYYCHLLVHLYSAHKRARTCTRKHTHTRIH